MLRLTQIAFASLMFLCASCSSSDVQENRSVQTPHSEYSVCQNPRPKICTREYKPVCATKLTGVQCITVPCPSTEEVSYASACTACADPKVLKYKKGACN